MNNAENKELVTRYFNELWSNGNLEKEADYVSADVIVHAPPPPGETVSLVYAASAFRAALPDLNVLEHVVFGDGDRVVQRWLVAGTHNGADLFGVPAGGRKLTVGGVNIFRVAGGKITERWSTLDMAGLMQQLRPTS
jgi:steroid delta-isomerase-like uncharacterized protein